MGLATDLIGLGMPAPQASRLEAGVPEAGNGWRLDGTSLVAAVGGTDSVAIDSSGNFILSSNAQDILSNNSSRGLILRGGWDGSSVSSQVQIWAGNSGSTAQGAIIQAQTAAAGGNIRLVTGNLGNIIFADDGDVEFARFDQSGNLGIGTSTTGSVFSTMTALRVSGNAGASFALQTGTTIHGLLHSDSGLTYLSCFGSTGLDIGCQSTAFSGSTATGRMRIKPTGQVRFIPLASDPSGAEAGDVYYNGNINKLLVYDGTSWVALH